VSVVLATVLGIGLRFVPMPDYLLPVIVGVGVAAGVVLLLLLLNRPAGDTSLGGRNQPPGDGSKPATPAVPAEVSARLNALTQRPGRPGRRDLRDN
jgi:hypothetical protein